MKNILLASVLLAASVTFTAAQDVDTELLFLVDTSASVTPDELQIQREGHRKALADPDLIRRIKLGSFKKVAFRYAEWGTSGVYYTYGDWAIIEDEISMQNFINSIPNDPNFRRIQMATATGYAIERGIEDILSNGIKGDRLIIDITSDGPANDPERLKLAREQAKINNIIINAISLKTDQGAVYKDMMNYLKDYVRTGPGSFVVETIMNKNFALSLKRKIYMEMF